MRLFHLHLKILTTHLTGNDCFLILTLVAVALSVRKSGMGKFSLGARAEKGMQTADELLWRMLPVV